MPCENPDRLSCSESAFCNAVRHVHIVAPEPVLQQRYVVRGTADLNEYLASVAHPNEQSARSLSDLADKVLDTHMYSPFQIAGQIMEIWEM